MTAPYIPEYLAAAPCPLNGPTQADHSFAFLLIPGFTMVGFASAVEPLRLANMVTDALLFSAVTVALDAEPVPASNGIRVMPDHTINSMPSVNTVIVCGANPIRYPDVERLVKWLRALDRQHVELGSVDSGSELLARAGLLDGYRCTIHWQDLGVMLARYPRLIVSNRLYEIDRDRFTSGGGTAAMDMMLTLIRRVVNGPEIAAATADLLVHARIREGADQQRIPLRQRLGDTRPKLSAAIEIMEGNLDDPLRMSELALHVRLSERQLERLFREHLGCTPSQYYRDLRLYRARRELLHTDHPSGEIASRCGFRSSSHFARRYAERFGVKPTEDRRRSRGMAVAQRA